VQDTNNIIIYQRVLLFTCVWTVYVVKTVTTVQISVFLVLSMFRSSVDLNFLLLIFVRAEYCVLLYCVVRCILSEVKCKKHIYVYLYFFIFLYWKLKTLRARSFGIFRNKNIFRNLFQLFCSCSWEQNGRNGNPGIPDWE